MSQPAPRPTEPALQTAARLLAEGRPAAAAERLGALVAEAPTYAAAHVLRATALEAAGLVDPAIVAWGRAAALVPRSPLVHRERERLMATRVADDLPEPDAPPATAASTPPADAPASTEPPADGPAPPTPAASASDGPHVADELDALIAQLEHAPRIKPDPAFSGPAVSLDTPEVDDLASETLAKIYAAQHQYVEAAVVYEQLAAKRPADAADLLRRAAELRDRA